jgi:hypothetical protein
MANAEKTKKDRLDRIITIRMTGADHNILLRMSENRRASVSKMIRTIINIIIDMVRENNLIE